MERRELYCPPANAPDPWPHWGERCHDVHPAVEAQGFEAVHIRCFPGYSIFFPLFQVVGKDPFFS
jgi:hypothetical protein